MINSRVINILKTFSENEVKEFERFLKSPFHNTKTNVIHLFLIMKDFRPDYSDPQLNKKFLTEQLSGNKIVKDSYLRNLLSVLNSLAEDFLGYKHLSKSGRFEKHIIEELNLREVTNAFEERLKLFEVSLDSKKSDYQNFYSDKVFVNEMKGQFYANKILFESYRKDELKNKLFSFLISMLETTFYFVVEEQRLNIKNEPGFLKHALEYFKNNTKEIEESPLVKIYYYAFLCFYEKDDEANFKKFKTSFSNFKDQLSVFDKKNIFSLISAYYEKKIREGKFSYETDFLLMLTEMVEGNLFTYKNTPYIDLFTIRNIVLLSCRLNETKVLEKFISENKSKINPGNKDTILNYTYSFISFMKKDHKKVLSYISKISFNDFLDTANTLLPKPQFGKARENYYFKNDIKCLTLICFYELGYIEEALAQIDSHRHFLKNAVHMNEDLKLKNKKFLSFINELINLNLNHDEYKLKQFRKKVVGLEIKKRQFQNWLLEKTDELLQLAVNS
ncbi:MAG: hypothetical protein ABI462_11625 [Ignavibacteria bacterium]